MRLKELVPKTVGHWVGLAALIGFVVGLVAVWASSYGRFRECEAECAGKFSARTCFWMCR
jgi:hypothetical protein